MRVGIFATCLVDVFFPEVGISMVRVLRRLGFDVDVPEGQTCCGQPAFNTGYWEEARRAAKGLIRALEPYDAVVAPSGSCTAMVRRMYPRLMEEEPEWSERARAIASRCLSFPSFWCIHGLVDLAPAWRETATYHHSCHMRRELRVTDAPLKLLAHVRGLTLKELPRGETAAASAEPSPSRWAEFPRPWPTKRWITSCPPGPIFSLGSDMGCLMNLGGRLSRRGGAGGGTSRRPGSGSGVELK